MTRTYSQGIGLKWPILTSSVAILSYLGGKERKFFSEGKCRKYKDLDFRDSKMANIKKVCFPGAYLARSLSSRRLASPISGKIGSAFFQSSRNV